MEELVYNREVSRTQQYLIMLLLIFISFLIPFFLKNWEEVRPRQPKVENGVIDLRKWNFLKYGDVSLSGAWRFKYLDDNKTYAYNRDAGRKWPLLSIPTDYYMSDYNPAQYHWLRCFVMLPPAGMQGQLLFSYAGKQMPANVYIDGENQPVTGAERLVDKLFVFPLSPDRNVILIAVRISNVYRTMDTFHIKAGLVARDYRGMTGDNYNFYLALVAGIMLIMIVYNFMLWFDNRGEKAGFFLMLYTLIIFCRVVSTYIYSNNLLSDSAALAAWINLKFLYLNHSLGWIFFLSFLYILLKDEIHKILLLFFQVAGVLVSFMILITDNTGFLFIVNQVITLSACLWITVCLVRAVKHNKEGAGIILVGIVFYILTIINDILLDHALFRSVYISEWGYVIFIFFYSRYQSLFFTQASRKAQYLSQNINHEIEKQTYILKKQKIELERVNLFLDSQKRKLEETNIRQKEMDEARTVFFQNISHEFCTPLSLILAPLEFAINGKFGAVSPELLKHLEMIRNNAMRLLILINQVLDLARLDANKALLEKEKVDLVQLFKYTTAAFESLALRKNIRYRVQAPEESFYTLADKKKTEMIIYNLLSNAFKFTDNGGMVTAVLDITVADNTAAGNVLHQVRISIKDSGIGIPEAELPYIFDRFRQVDNSLTRKYGGTGIGLSVVKEYTELHKGTIEVQSAPGTGSEFTVRFAFDCLLHEPEPGEPVNSASSLTAPEFSIDTASAYPAGDEAYNSKIEDNGRQCILVIEDNPDMRLYIRSILNTKYRVYEAVNGRDALDKLAALPRPDLIISDVMMAEMDGFAFYKTISADAALNTIPLIFLSAKTGTEEKLAALALGAIDYLYKPLLSEHELLFKIDALLKNHKLQLALYEKDKYASIGMLFGGILHEILNPLGGIHAPLENLERILSRTELPANMKIKKYFEQIFSNLERIEKLVKSSRLLFYKKEGESERIDMEKLLSSIRDIFYNKIKTRIKLTTLLEKDVRICTNYDALTHILINLVSNAVDAIKSKGEISIKVFTHNSKPVVVVKDTGSGIKKENFKRIFEPFYTEKEAGKGTGMGLYFVKTLVHKICWKIEVLSEPGKGTEFILSGE